MPKPKPGGAAKVAEKKTTLSPPHTPGLRQCGYGVGCSTTRRQKVRVGSKAASVR
jgi:hypothetical protein